MDSVMALVLQVRIVLLLPLAIAVRQVQGVFIVVQEELLDALPQDAHLQHHGNVEAIAIQLHLAEIMLVLNAHNPIIH